MYIFSIIYKLFAGLIILYHLNITVVYNYNMFVTPQIVYHSTHDPKLWNIITIIMLTNLLLGNRGSTYNLRIIIIIIL